jgi:hypothetical protein
MTRCRSQHAKKQKKTNKKTQDKTKWEYAFQAKENNRPK